MVGALKDENLRQPFIKELVVANDLIGTSCAQPILITVTESYWEGQLTVPEAVALHQAVMRVATEFERRCKSLLGP